MFFRSTIFLAFLALRTEEVWPDETHLMLLTESNCVCMPNFRPVAPFFFLAKVPFLALFFNIERSVNI